MFFDVFRIIWYRLGEPSAHRTGEGAGGTCFYLSSGTAVEGRLKGFAVLVNVIVPCY